MPCATPLPPRTCALALNPFTSSRMPHAHPGVCHLCARSGPPPQPQVGLQLRMPTSQQAQSLPEQALTHCLPPGASILAMLGDQSPRPIFTATLSLMVAAYTSPAALRTVTLARQSSWCFLRTASRSRMHCKGSSHGRGGRMRRDDGEGGGLAASLKAAGARGGSTTLQPSTSVQHALLLSLLSTTAAAPIASVCVCVCWGWGEGCPSSHLAQSTVAIQVVIKDAGCARVRNDVGVALLKMVVREGPVIQG